MANTKISQLTPNTNPNGGEELVYAYNNTNGKMTLNTMKGYVENNLSGYVTASDLSDGLATKQDSLVSGTNIKTINGTSILGSGNLVISGGGGTGEDNDYDAVVDVNGGGDYTSISDAITAGIKRIYVRNGIYTMSSQTLSTGNFKLVGEDKKGTIINVLFSESGETIFPMTSDTVSISNSFLIKNVSINVSYTGAYGFFNLFGLSEKQYLTLQDCNICVVSAANGCNFYLGGGDGAIAAIGCYIEVYPATGTPSGLALLCGPKLTCIDSTVVIDAGTSINSAIEFGHSNMEGTFIGCILSVGKTHNKAGDIANFGGAFTNIIGCTCETSASANIRLFGTFNECTLPTIGASASYDTALSTAVTGNNIAPWKASTSYTVGQYVSCGGNNSTLFKCKTAHTSGTTFDKTKFTEVYGDVYIGASISNSSMTVGGMVLFSGAGQTTGLDMPVDAGNTGTFTITVKPATGVSNSAIIVPGYKKIQGLTIKEGYNYAGGFKVLLCGECAHFSNNTILASQGSVYSSGKDNMIVNNIWTYVTGGVAPTITQVTGGNSVLDNNIIYATNDWTA